MKSILITAVGGPAGNAALTSLKKEYNVIAADMDKYAPALHSKGIVPRVIPSANDSNYISHIIKLCNDQNIEMVLPCSDEEILTISKHHDLFHENNIVLPIPEYSQIIKVSDKYNLMQLAKNANVKIPKTYKINNSNDIKELDSELKYPCVIKPRFSRGARGINYCVNRKELLFFYEKLSKEYANKLMIQEYIPGGEGSVFVNQTIWNKKSELVSSGVIQKIKEKPKTGGVASVAETVYREDLVETTRHLFQRIGSWIGPAGVEYKTNEANNFPYLMEINPRLQGITLSFYPYLDFPKIWVDIGFNVEIKKNMYYPKEQVLIRTWEDKRLKKGTLFFNK